MWPSQPDITQLLCSYSFKPTILLLCSLHWRLSLQCICGLGICGFGYTQTRKQSKVIVLAKIKPKLWVVVFADHNFSRLYPWQVAREICIWKDINFLIKSISKLCVKFSFIFLPLQLISCSIRINILTFQQMFFFKNWLFWNRPV